MPGRCMGSVETEGHDTFPCKPLCWKWQDMPFKMRNDIVSNMAWLCCWHLWILIPCVTWEIVIPSFVALLVPFPMGPSESTIFSCWRLMFRECDKKKLSECIITRDFWLNLYISTFYKKYTLRDLPSFMPICIMVKRLPFGKRSKVTCFHYVYWNKYNLSFRQ